MSFELFKILFISLFRLVKCALHHPHHVLPKVLALVNAFKDDEFIKGAKNKSTISSSPRSDAAVKLLRKMKTYGQLCDTIIQMERMFEGKKKPKQNCFVIF